MNVRWFHLSEREQSEMTKIVVTGEVDSTSDAQSLAQKGLVFLNADQSAGELTQEGLETFFPANRDMFWMMWTSLEEQSQAYLLNMRTQKAGMDAAPPTELIEHHFVNPYGGVFLLDTRTELIFQAWTRMGLMSADPAEDLRRYRLDSDGAGGFVEGLMTYMRQQGKTADPSQMTRDLQEMLDQMIGAGRVNVSVERIGASLETFLKDALNSPDVQAQTEARVQRYTDSLCPYCNQPLTRDQLLTTAHWSQFYIDEVGPRPIHAECDDLETQRIMTYRNAAHAAGLDPNKLFMQSAITQQNEAVVVIGYTRPDGQDVHFGHEVQAVLQGIVDLGAALNRKTPLQ